MHAIEKIMAKASGQEKVNTGEIINAKIDFAEVNDLYLQTIKSFYEIGGKKIWDKNRLTFVFDHYAPAPTILSASIHREMRKFIKENELTYHFDINEGVCHQVMPESGLILPGTIVTATDSHTTTHGAFGALGTGIGATDMATVMMTGELWFRVPEIIEIQIEGIPERNVMPKDVILYILGQMKSDGAIYKAIEFKGSYVDQLTIAGRMVICNMAVEMGAKTAYMQPNDLVVDYVSKRTSTPFEVQFNDDDYEYDESYSFDISKLSPQIAVPHSVDKVNSIEEIGKIKVDQGIIGTCTGGRTEDIEIAARILKDHKLSRDVRLIVIPASREVLQECIKKGYIQDLIDSGATITTPGCGPCLGAHEGVLAPGEVAISASNRNFPGRMGSVTAEIYLASPATVAASVRNGYISDSRLF